MARVMAEKREKWRQTSDERALRSAVLLIVRKPKA
jgi:hypothetical protein